MKKIYSFFDIKKPSSESLLFFCNISGCCFGDNFVCYMSYISAHAYSPRIIPLLAFFYPEGTHTLLLEHTYDEYILTYFNSLRLRLPNTIHIVRENVCKLFSSLTRTQNILSQHLDISCIKTIDASILTPEIAELAHTLNIPTFNDPQIIKQSNSKWWLFKMQQKNFLPHLETIIIHHYDDMVSAFNELKAQGYKTVCLKTEYSVGSNGMKQIPTTTDFIPFIADSFVESQVLLLQGWLDETVEQIKVIGSPATQAYINDTGPFIFGITEQLLTKPISYVGCYAPIAYLVDTPSIEEELYTQAYTLLQEIYHTGYRGPVGIDFVITQKNNSINIMACDINTRMTASMPPLILAEYMQPGCTWVSKNVLFLPSLTSALLLERLNSLSLLYKPGTNKTILPYHFYTQKEYTGALLLFLGYTPQEAQDTLIQLKDITYVT